MKYIILILALFLISCGSRKVELHKTTEKLNNSELIEIKSDYNLTTQIDVINKFVAKNTSFEADSIVIRDNVVVIHKPKHKTNEIQSESSQTEVKKEVDKGEETKQTTINEQRTDKTKNTKRDNTIFSLGFILIIIISLVIYFKVVK